VASIAQSSCITFGISGTTCIASHFSHSLGRFHTLQLLIVGTIVDKGDLAVLRDVELAKHHVVTDVLAVDGKTWVLPVGRAELGEETRVADDFRSMSLLGDLDGAVSAAS
jgi:hypothetical protein